LRESVSEHGRLAQPAARVLGGDPAVDGGVDVGAGGCVVVVGVGGIVVTGGGAPAPTSKRFGSIG
jgi:hypothetical protein